MIGRGLAVAVAAASIVGCGSDDAALDDSAVLDGGFAVSAAWTRPSPPGVSEAAIYLSIENRDAPDDRFIGSASERCVVMHPHLTDIDDAGVASMTTADFDQLGLPTGGTLTMAPSGLHVMCLGLSEPLELGEVFEIELQFSEHEPITVPVVVDRR